MIITVTFNPAIDKTGLVDELVVGGLNRLHDVVADAGGKGINVSKTIHALKGRSIATGFLGGNTGNFISNYFDLMGIENSFIQVEGETRTNLKVLNKEMVLTELNEPGPRVDEHDIEKLIHQLEKEAGNHTWVVLSGNTGPGVPTDIYKRIIERLHEKDINVILDADGELFRHGLKAGPAAVKPNNIELAQYFGLDGEDLSIDEIIELGTRLLNEKTKLVAVSMGIQGSIFMTKEKTIVAKALKIDYRSAVGAGDAMVAAMAYGLDKGMNLEEIVKLSVATSAGACMSEGTSPADLETVLELKERVEMKEWSK